MPQKLEVPKKVAEFEKKKSIEPNKIETEKIIASNLERLENCKKELEKRKQITSSLTSLTIKKCLNNISKDLKEALGNIEWCQKNKINIDKSLEKKLEEIKVEIDGIKEENFEKKHGSKRENVFNLKECKIAIQKLETMKDQLNKSYKSVDSPEKFKEFEIFAKNIQSSATAYDEKCTKTLRALKSINDSYAQYDAKTTPKIVDIKALLSEYNEEFKKSKKKREEFLKLKKKMDVEYGKVSQARKEKTEEENNIKKEDTKLSSICKNLGTSLVNFGKNILSFIPKDNYDDFI